MHILHTAPVIASRLNRQSHRTLIATLQTPDHKKRTLRSVKTQLRHSIENVTIELSHPHKWQAHLEKNAPFTMKFAGRWAKFMQLEMAQGKSVAEVAETALSRTSLLNPANAETDGMTILLAITALSECWKYGPALKRWHKHAHSPLAAAAPQS